MSNAAIFVQVPPPPPQPRGQALALTAHRSASSSVNEYEGLLLISNDNRLGWTIIIAIN